MATASKTDTRAPARRGRKAGKPAGTSGEDKPADAGAKGTQDPRSPAVRVQAGVLAQALKDVDELVEAKATVPIVSHVLFAAGDGAIHLTGTDLDATITRDCETNDRDGPGSKDWLAKIRPFTVALPAKPLARLLASFDSEGMVTITAGDGEATIACGRSRFRLRCLPHGDFPLPPAFPAEASFEMTCSALDAGLAAVKHAMSSEEARYYLNGVFLHHAGPGLRLAATDGHRLARYDLGAPDGAASFPAAIVPRKVIGLLDKLLAEAVKGEKPDSSPSTVLVEAGPGGTRLRFTLPAVGGGELSVDTKTIDGSFPDYERVIPGDTPHRLQLDRDALDEAVRRVLLIAAEKGRAVKLDLAERGDAATVSLASPDLGDGRDELPANWQGPAFATGFNGRYWREALAALAGDQLVMRFPDDQGGLAVIEAAAADGETSALLQVLMPMRV